MAAGQRMSLLVRLHVGLALMTSGWLPFPGVHCAGFKSGRHVTRDENQVLKATDSDKIVESLNNGRFGAALEYRRLGEPSETSSCDLVRPVPEVLRSRDVMKPDGISAAFYQKYTEAYGIPVVGPSSVPDAALSRACYVLRFLLADRVDLRRAYYESFGRVAVIGRRQTLAAVPEYRSLTFDDSSPPPRADGPGLTVRGLPAVAAAPVSTAPEENVLCYDGEPREQDDVLLKTLAIGILNLAVDRADASLKSQLDDYYVHAMRSGRWHHTNAARSPESYFGEGVQSFFNANAYANPPDGYHNEINMRTKLRSYDTSLYAFVQNMFPCANSYMKRCNSRGNEALQTLNTNCPESGWFSVRRSQWS